METRGLVVKPDGSHLRGNGYGSCNHHFKDLLNEPFLLKQG